MKKVLVTGSLGYIGSVLVPYLSEHNFECVGYDSGFFKDCYLYSPETQKTIMKDARNLSKDDLKGVDAVVHLAAMSNDPLMSLPPEIFYDPVRRYRVDTRSYKVSFDKIGKVFSGFQCDWTVQKGIREMIDCFQKIRFSEKQFSNMNFYRLQKMEYLLKNGYLTEELFWTNRQVRE